AWASAQGHLWVGSSSQSVASELLDRPPTSVARRGPLLSEVMAFTPDVTMSFVPGRGLSSSLQLGVVSAVSRSPEWIVTETRRVLDLAGMAADSEPKLLGVVGNLVNSFTPPYLAASAQSAAAHVLVATAGSSIFSAEMDATLAGQQLYASLGLKVVSPSQIDSLAFPPQAPAGVYLRGYVVSCPRRWFPRRCGSRTTAAGWASPTAPSTRCRAGCRSLLHWGTE
ncbi:MAG: hypothetical protein H6Q89_3737, partial [Myxococcaceae bacterium]|nr:hypothetical protein [Myxococcaceae bacterium]